MAFIIACSLSLFALTASAKPQFGFSGGDITSDGPTSIPTGPVVAITLPGGVDGQILIGSVVAPAGPLTTVAISCPEGTDPEDCGFDPPITLTAGPSTLYFSIAYDDINTVEQACQISEVGAQCQITEIGIQSDLITATDVDSSTMTGISTTTITTAFGANELTAVDITLVGGQTAGLSVISTATATGTLVESSGASDSLVGFGTATQTSTSSSGSSATKTSTSTHTGSSSSTSQGSASAAASSSTRAPNAAATLVPGAAGLGLIGLAALLL